MIKVKMSNRRVLLVEGRDDKRFFKLLIDALCQSHDDKRYKLSRIFIDTASIIRCDNALGNGEKVELVSILINDRSYSNRFIGFVDREFREFSIGDSLEDNINNHNRIGRLVWSRGHSTENYFFDYDTLREPLRDFSVSEYFDDALDLFEDSFEDIIRLACLVTMLAKNHELLNVIRGSVNWESLHFVSNTMVLNTDSWKVFLAERKKLDQDRISNLLYDYDSWSRVVEKSDFDVVRWLCHGHIGLSIIWAAYSRCIYEICVSKHVKEPDREAIRVLKAEESVRFNACASAWVRNSIGNQIDSPQICFELLLAE